MGKFKLMLDRLIGCEIKIRDLAFKNKKLNYQYQELVNDSRIEINLLNSKISEYEYIMHLKPEPKANKDE